MIRGLAEQKANKYAYNESSRLKKLTSDTWLAGYCRAMDDLKSLLESTKANKTDELKKELFEFIKKQEG